MKKTSVTTSKQEQVNVGSPLPERPDTIFFSEDFFSAPLGKWKLSNRLTLTCIRVEFYNNNVFSLIVTGTSDDMKTFVVAGYFDQYKWIQKYFKMYFPETETDPKFNGKLEYRYESCAYLDSFKNELQLKFQAHVIAPKPEWHRSR